MRIMMSSALWTQIDVDFSHDDETCNFGRRMEFAPKNSLYVLQTLATVSCVEKVSKEPHFYGCIDDHLSALIVDGVVSVFSLDPYTFLLSIDFEFDVKFARMIGGLNLLIVLLDAPDHQLRFFDINEQRIVYSENLQCYENGIQFVQKFSVAYSEKALTICYCSPNGIMTALLQFSTANHWWTQMESNSSTFVTLSEFTNSCQDIILVDLTTLLLMGKFPHILSLWKLIDNNWIFIRKVACTLSERILHNGICICDDRYLMCYDDTDSVGHYLMLYDFETLIAIKRWKFGHKILHFVLTSDSRTEKPLSIESLIFAVLYVNDQCQQVVEIRSLANFYNPLYSYISNGGRMALVRNYSTPAPNNPIFVLETAKTSSLIPSQFPDQIRIREISAVDPRVKLQRLINRRKFDDAHAFAELFHLDSQEIYKSVAKHLIAKLSILPDCDIEKDSSDDRNVVSTGGGLDQLIACLQKVQDTIFVCKLCLNSSALQLHYYATLLHYAKTTLNSSSSSNSDLFTLNSIEIEICRMLYKLTSFMQISQNIEISEFRITWRAFNRSNLIDMAEYFLKKRYITCFNIILQRHAEEFAKNFDFDTCKRFFDYLADWELPSLTKFLEYHLFPAIILPAKFDEKFAEILADFLINRSETYEFEHGVTEDLLNFVKLLERFSFGRFNGRTCYSILDLSKFRNVKIQQLNSLIAEFTEIRRLNSNHKFFANFTLKLNEFRKHTTKESICSLILDKNAQLSDLIEECVAKYLVPYVREHGLNLDKVIFSYIENLLKRRFCKPDYSIAEAKAILLLEHMENVTYKLQSVITLITYSPLPYSQTLKKLIKKILGTYSHPLICDIEQRWLFAECKLIAQKYTINSKYLQKSPRSVIRAILSKFPSLSSSEDCDGQLAAEDIMKDGIRIAEILKCLDAMECYFFRCAILFKHDNFSGLAKLLESIETNLRSILLKRLFVLIDNNVRFVLLDFKSSKIEYVSYCDKILTLLSSIGSFISIDRPVRNELEESFISFERNIRSVRLLALNYDILLSYDEFTDNCLVEIILEQILLEIDKRNLHNNNHYFQSILHLIRLADLLRFDKHQFFELLFNVLTKKFDDKAFSNVLQYVFEYEVDNPDLLEIAFNIFKRQQSEANHFCNLDSIDFSVYRNAFTALLYRCPPEDLFEHLKEFVRFNTFILQDCCSTFFYSTTEEFSKENVETATFERKNERKSSARVRQLYSYITTTQTISENKEESMTHLLHLVDDIDGDATDMVIIQIYPKIAQYFLSYGGPANSLSIVINKKWTQRVHNSVRTSALVNGIDLFFGFVLLYSATATTTTMVNMDELFKDIYLNNCKQLANLCKLAGCFYYINNNNDSTYANSFNFFQKAYYFYVMDLLLSINCDQIGGGKLLGHEITSTFSCSGHNGNDHKTFIFKNFTSRFDDLCQILLQNWHLIKSAFNILHCLTYFNFNKSESVINVIRKLLLSDDLLSNAQIFENIRFILSLIESRYLPPVELTLELDLIFEQMNPYAYERLKFVLDTIETYENSVVVDKSIWSTKREFLTVLSGYTRCRPITYEEIAWIKQIKNENFSIKLSSTRLPFHAFFPHCSLNLTTKIDSENCVNNTNRTIIFDENLSKIILLNELTLENFHFWLKTVDHFFTKKNVGYFSNSNDDSDWLRFTCEDFVISFTENAIVDHAINRECLKMIHRHLVSKSEDLRRALAVMFHTTEKITLEDLRIDAYYCCLRITEKWLESISTLESPNKKSDLKTAKNAYQNILTKCRYHETLNALSRANSLNDITKQYADQPARLVLRLLRDRSSTFEKRKKLFEQLAEINTVDLKKIYESVAENLLFNADQDCMTDDAKEKYDHSGISAFINISAETIDKIAFCLQESKNANDVGFYLASIIKETGPFTKDCLTKIKALRTMQKLLLEEKVAELLNNENSEILLRDYIYVVCFEKAGIVKIRNDFQKGDKIYMINELISLFKKSIGQKEKQNLIISLSISLIVDFSIIDRELVQRILLLIASSDYTDQLLIRLLKHIQQNPDLWLIENIEETWSKILRRITEDPDLVSYSYALTNSLFVVADRLGYAT